MKPFTGPLCLTASSGPGIIGHTHTFWPSCMYHILLEMPKAEYEKNTEKLMLTNKKALESPKK